jgi:hypothetical protein
MDLLRVKENLQKDGIFFSFNGYMSQNVLGGLGDAIEGKLTDQKVQNSTVTNIFAIFTEQMQNVMSYSAERYGTEEVAESIGISIVGFSELKKKYFIGSGNFIKEEDKISLLKKLEKINSMNRDELRSYYKELRKSGENKHRRGAGLGFLEMAKRGSEPLEYSVKNQADGKLFFQLFVYV